MKGDIFAKYFRPTIDLYLIGDSRSISLKVNAGNLY